MRKLIMSLSVLAGLLFAGTLPASANAGSGLAAAKIAAPAGEVTKAGWRHRHYRRHYGHRHWGHRRHWRHRHYWRPGFYIGVPFHHRRHWRHRHWY